MGKINIHKQRKIELKRANNKYLLIIIKISLFILLLSSVLPTLPLAAVCVCVCVILMSGEYIIHYHSSRSQCER